MAVPKKKSSNSRTRRRRAHDFLVPKQTSPCPNCSFSKPVHVVCPNCGYYGGRVVNPPKTQSNG